jgi:hypothetical protein
VKPIRTKKQKQPDCSQFQVSVLNALLHGNWWSARQVAEKVWEPVKSRAFGHRHGQWQSMGAQLSRLCGLGLVEVSFSSTNQKLWRITSVGHSLVQTEKPDPRQ